MKFLVPDVLPEWFVLMNDDALLSAKEITTLFGFKEPKNFCHPGSFPKADRPKGSRKKSVMMSFKYKKSYWMKSTIINEIQRRKEMIANGTNY